MSNIAKQIGHRIKIRRAVLNMTQDKLAEILGITQAYLSFMESGARPIDAEMLDKLAKALECDTSDLLNERRRLA
jgi:transcriptional regulator with XRE-family HTH domain